MRLAVYQKEEIRSELLSDITKTNGRLSDDLSKKIQRLADSKIPTEVLDMFAKYPSLSRERSLRYVKIEYPKGGQRNYHYYNVIMSGENKEFLLTEKEVNDNDEIMEIVKQLYESRKISANLRRDIDKLLETINTHKQLKDRFPTGYKVLKKLTRDTKSEEPDLTGLPESITERLESFKEEGK